MSDLFYLGFNQIDSVVNEVTTPSEINFETQEYLINETNFNSLSECIHEKYYVELHQKASGTQDVRLQEM